MSMTKDEIAEVVKLAVMETLAVKDEIIGTEFDDRYHDVNLLMKRYRWLKKYYANVSPEVLDLDSICNTRRKTGLMMDHVEKMLAAYKSMCQEVLSERERLRWDILYLRYLSDEVLKIDTIAERLNVDRSTVFRYSNKAIEDLSVLLFGIEAIGSWKNKA